MSPEAIVIAAPVPAPRARLDEGRQDFAGKAVVADAGHGAFDASFIAGMPHAGGIDVEVARLRVFEKGGRDARRERVGCDDDRLRVIRNEDLEDAAKKLPRRFARFDGAGRRFLEGGIDEAVARAHRREDPGAKPPAFALGQGEPADPARIDLHFLARLAIQHRDRRRGLAKLQLEDREPMQRRIRDLDAVAHEQLPDLREPHAVAEPALDGRALLDARRPAVAPGTTARGMQREQDLAGLLVAHRRRDADASGRGAP